MTGPAGHTLGGASEAVTGQEITGKEGEDAGVSGRELAGGEDAGKDDEGVCAHAKPLRTSSAKKRLITRPSPLRFTSMRLQLCG